MLLNAIILIALVLIVTPLVFLVCLKLLGPLLGVKIAKDAFLAPLLKKLFVGMGNVVKWLWDRFKF